MARNSQQTVPARPQQAPAKPDLKVADLMAAKPAESKPAEAPKVEAAKAETPKAETPKAEPKPKASPAAANAPRTVTVDGTTVTIPPAPKNESAQQAKNRLRNIAERIVLDRHKPEFHKVASELYGEFGFDFKRRLTDEEKAQQKIDELLKQHPELREKYFVDMTRSLSTPFPSRYSSPSAFIAMGWFMSAALVRFSIAFAASLVQP